MSRAAVEGIRPGSGQRRQELVVPRALELVLTGRAIDTPLDVICAPELERDAVARRAERGEKTPYKGSEEDLGTIIDWLTSLEGS